MPEIRESEQTRIEEVKNRLSEMLFSFDDNFNDLVQSEVIVPSELLLLQEEDFIAIDEAGPSKGLKKMLAIIASRGKGLRSLDADPETGDDPYRTGQLEMQETLGDNLKKKAELGKIAKQYGLSTQEIRIMSTEELEAYISNKRKNKTRKNKSS